MFSEKENKIQRVLFLLWIIITLTLIYFHAFWMDEVINLIFGIGADPQYGIHGNGHPALWFLLLRSLFAIFHKVWVLPLASFLIAATSVWLFLFKSPFSLQFKILFLCSNFALYEYVVIARNYGISMLFMFILAMVVASKKFKENLTGPCLFILCNTNILSVIISMSYFLGIVLNSMRDKTIREYKVRKLFYKVALCNFLGALICFFTVYPTFDTDAEKDFSHFFKIEKLENVFFIAQAFNKITYYPYFHQSNKTIIKTIGETYKREEIKENALYYIDDQECFKEYISKNYTQRCLSRFDGRKKSIIYSVSRSVFSYFCSILLILSLFSFYGEFSLFIAASTSLLGLAVFFSFIYWGNYRHQALWLVFMITLLWISKTQKTQLRIFSSRVMKLRSIGYKSFIFLMFLQIWPALDNAYNEIFGTPSSNSKKLADLIKNDNSIKYSAIMASSDLLLEAIHYYNSNPTFVISEKKFALVFPFGANDNTNYSLDDILNSANYISFCNHVPVLILLAEPNSYDNRVNVDGIKKPTLYRYMYLNFYIDPKQLARLQYQTHKIASFDQSLNENGFSVYKLSYKDAHIEGNCTANYIFDRNMFDLEGSKKR